MPEFITSWKLSSDLIHQVLQLIPDPKDAPPAGYEDAGIVLKINKNKDLICVKAIWEKPNYAYSEVHPNAEVKPTVNEIKSEIPEPFKGLPPIDEVFFSTNALESLLHFVPGDPQPPNGIIFDLTHILYQETDNNYIKYVGLLAYPDNNDNLKTPIDQGSNKGKMSYFIGASCPPKWKPQGIYMAI